MKALLRLGTFKYDGRMSEAKNMISDEAVEAAADCAGCGHPCGHHDAGECWTNAQGREVSGGSTCDCGWYEPKVVSP